MIIVLALCYRPPCLPCDLEIAASLGNQAEQRLARVLRHRGVRCTCVGGRLLGQLQHRLLHSCGGKLGQVQRTAGLWLPDRPLSKATAHPEISLLYQPYLLWLRLTSFFFSNHARPNSR